MRTQRSSSAGSVCATISRAKMELNDRYYCQRLDAFGEIIGETEKAYKLSVEALFMSGEKNVTIWCPKSCVENVVEA